MNNRILLSISVLMLVFFSRCSNKMDPGYEIFMVRFTNYSDSTITGITLQMIGSDDTIRVADLGISQTTEYQQVILPDCEGPIPDSWGDYYGQYTRKNAQEDINIMNYDHKFRSSITIVITNSAYTFVSP